MLDVWKSGHVTLKCFKRFNVHFTEVNNYAPQTYITDVNVVDYSQVDQFYKQSHDPSWYVDSVATNHITHDLHNVSTPFTGWQWQPNSHKFH